MSKILEQIKNWPELARKTKWSTSAMAKQCGVSVRTLERHFHRTLRQTPSDWLAVERQKYAETLLSNRSSVKETASLIGYSHASTFARAFRKQTGRCPNAFRNNSGPNELDARNVA
jgi:AraC-like DNA-binding protein